jgi:hypothetical protein
MPTINMPLHSLSQLTGLAVNILRIFSARAYTIEMARAAVTGC